MANFWNGQVTRALGTVTAPVVTRGDQAPYSSATGPQTRRSDSVLGQVRTILTHPRRITDTTGPIGSHFTGIVSLTGKMRGLRGKGITDVPSKPSLRARGGTRGPAAWTLREGHVYTLIFVLHALVTTPSWQTVAVITTVCVDTF